MNEVQGYIPIMIDNRTVRVSLQTARVWEEFLGWVEGTALFHAIKNDPSGTDIMAEDGSLHLSLKKNVQKAEELPVQVLAEFFINSSFYDKPFYSPLKSLLTNG